MFAYCRNNPVSRKDASGTHDMCIINFNEDSNPFNDLVSPSGGGGGGGIATRKNKGLVEKAVDFLTNTSEEVVLEAEYFTFYKGIPIVKLPIGDEAFSAGFVIIMGNDVQNVQTVRHEYGHSVHSRLIGMKKYIKYAFIPSLIGYWTGVEYDMYYSQPWEYTAEILGDVIRDGETYNYSSIAEPVFYCYFVLTLIAPN